MARSAPRDEHDLRVRAFCLSGRTLGEIADEHRFFLGKDALHTKGKAGELLEFALGATGGGQTHDFPALGIELKTIPVDENGRPRESTFVCAISIASAEQIEWRTSWAKKKLAHVLWIPIHTPSHAAWNEQRVLSPMFWEPTREQEAILAADFADVMGIIASGGIERLTAHTGRWLQARPKAAHGRVRTTAFGPDGEAIATVPRGFYLRSRFTEAILKDERALPE
jgi:DNA mismatch repair protein MutH